MYIDDVDRKVSNNFKKCSSGEWKRKPSHGLNPFPSPTYYFCLLLAVYKICVETFHQLESLLKLSQNCLRKKNVPFSFAFTKRKIAICPVALPQQPGQYTNRSSLSTRRRCRLFLSIVRNLISSNVTSSCLYPRRFTVGKLATLACKRR